MNRTEQQPKEPKRGQRIFREIKAVVLMSLMITVEALAVKLLYTPAGVVTGGVTGIGMLISYATNGAFPSWIFIVIANTPLLILAFRYLHIRFTIYSLLMTVLFSAELAIFESIPFPALFDVAEPAWRVVRNTFDAFEMKIHTRIVDIKCSPNSVSEITKFKIKPGVDINIKIWNE